MQKHNKSANKLAAIDFIYQEIAKRMVERLDYIKVNPNLILDIGSGQGIDSKLLKQYFPKAQVIQLDNALEVLNHYKPENKGFIKKIMNKNDSYVCGDALNLPIQSQSVDIVWSNLALPYIEDMESYFKEIRRVLKVGGYFLVTGFGVDSLEQLRDVGLQTFNFPDMHIIGDILVKLGYTHPVTDLEYINLEYDSYKQLLKDVQVIGCGNAISPQKTFSRSNYDNLENNFNSLSKDKKIKLTLEVFYAHAWKDHVSLDLPDDKKIVQFYSQKK